MREAWSVEKFPYPGPDVSNAPKLLVPSSIALCIALILYVTRIFVRVRPVCILGWDDYTVSVAMVSLDMLFVEHYRYSARRAVADGLKSL